MRSNEELHILHLCSEMPLQNGKMPALVSKKSLFDENSSSEDDGEDGGVTLGINEEFARRFEHNKKREERHRLEEKYKNDKPSRKEKGSESSSEDESDDEEACLVTEDLDAEISAVLTAIKKKDPRIYDKKAVFYKPVGAEAKRKEVKTEKSMTLKDYHRERYLQGDVGAEEEEKPPKVTPAQQEEALKQSILAEIKAANGDDEDEEWSGDDAFLKPKDPKPKKSAAEGSTENGLHPSRVEAVQLTETDIANADNNPEEYLSKFMSSRVWAAGSGLNWQPFDSDDEEAEEKAEEFEHAYNMRFEDPEKSNEVLKSYSRQLTASRSVRKDEVSGRKRARVLEKEKKEEERRQQDEERARLRRLKLEEASEKLAKIKQAAGASGKKIKDEEWLDFLDEAWDNDKWEEEMSKRFDDEYYAEADDAVVDENDAEVKHKKRKKTPQKPSWDDDVDITDLVPDFEDPAKVDVAPSDSEAVPAGDENSDSEADAEQPTKKKRKTTKSVKKERIAEKREARRTFSKLEALVDKTMALEQPRVLSQSQASGSFRYRETSPNSFGLTARDILLAPTDAALNEFAGLKKLAAFRDVDKKRRDKKRLGKKARLRQWRRETFGRDYEQTGPTYGFAHVVVDGDGDDGEGRGKERRAWKDGQERTKGGDGAGNVVEGERKKKRKRSKGKAKAVEAESLNGRHLGVLV